ncbi:MAG: toll/interleukin-1 receptor domain-containing protein [Verrucomicrobiota bacterium]
MPSSKPRYRAFISYSHRDAKWAKWLHRSLEHYVVPIDAFTEGKKPKSDGSTKNRRLTPVFRDRDELPASGSLGDTIHHALASSENLIVLCSPDSAASQYVNAEIDIFRTLHPDNEKKIYALIIKGEPPACFPPALLSTGAEPIAADARETGDGKTDSKLKLIAGLLGVGFDRLKRREAKRQRNRLMLMVTVISTVAVITSLLSLWALKSEQEANEARDLAEQRQLEAEKARRKAQDLATFIGRKMLETMDRRGNSRTLFEVVERMDAYYKDIPVANLSQEEKSYYMVAMIQGGEQALAELNLDAADDYSNRALALSKQMDLKDSDPFFSSAALLRVSFLIKKNTPDKAGDIIALLDEAITKSTPEDQFNLLIQKGSFLKNEGDFEEALSSYIQADKLAKHILTEEGMGVKSIMLIRGLLHNNYFETGLVYGKLGRKEKANTCYLRAINGAKEQLRRRPGNTDAMHIIFMASGALGHSFLADGKNGEAMIVFHKREEITKKILDLKPDNPIYQQALISARILEARHSPKLSIKEKTQLYEKALEDFKAIPKADDVLYGVDKETQVEIREKWMQELGELKALQ